MHNFFTEEQISLRDTARRFAEREVLKRAAAIDREDRFDRTLYRRMAELGLFGISLEEAGGGAGLDTVAVCIVMEELARCSGSVGNAFAIPVEATLFLHQHGSVAQRSRIPALLDGSAIAATAVSEPDHGSDVASITTSALRTADGYVLNGTKAWVTLGGVADWIFVFARTPSPDGRGDRHAISCFIVDAMLAGVTRGKSEELLGMHGLEDCQIAFDNVKLGHDALVGVEHQAFKMAMANFNFSRLLMSSMALGIAQAAFEDAAAYAGTRRQFGAPISSFQAIQFMLADMSTDIAASRLLIHHAARVHDAGRSIAKEAAHAKLFTTDMAMRHVSNALQIHGGNGYSREYRIERLFRDVRLAQIFEGTNQIQRLIIARQIEKELS
ncbi:acyl-CoA dehydrogenase [Caballeronia mineralivorans PML1(12)]|uniref:Acyl-CoA dehydrogenase n=1 Tax=Caballeronia mineralivorans PML1(12) TaxID=908627 RepID=A0A0J1D115_9BURK|nr:acyl-CoA dehydrogenase family protein [Caballeronia mineralivorans]KLU26425.1 acyl-CoA dehydrogenase [Caballeronia mineralivorans PML1(12)]